MKPSLSPRHEAVNCVHAWLTSARVPSDAASASGVVLEITHGVIRHQRYLEHILARSVNRMPVPEVYAVLLAGAYQLLFMNPADAFAVVHDMVDIVGSMRGKAVKGFVNAVLRGISRQRDALLAERESLPPGIRWSLPDWLADALAGDWGEVRRDRLGAWSIERPDTIVRLTATGAEAGAADKIRDAGIDLEPHAFRPATHFMMPRGMPVTRLPGFSDGWWTVQDPGTAVAIEQLDLQPGQDVLDACAAPGGKTGMIADAIGSQGRCLAVDSEDRRLKRLTDNARRLAWGQVICRRADATDPDALADTAAAAGFDLFDRILIDTPCSNTGVLRRKPDIRSNMTPDKIARLEKLQLRLLDACSGLLKPGGKLVYSTCSLLTRENEGQVQRWLDQNPHFRLEQSACPFPPEHGIDGAYAAALTLG